MFGLGMPELIIILVVVVIVFGGRRLPEIGAGLGKAITNFKNATKGKNSADPEEEKEKLENKV